MGLCDMFSVYLNFVCITEIPLKYDLNVIVHCNCPLMILWVAVSEVSHLSLLLRENGCSLLTESVFNVRIVLLLGPVHVFFTFCYVTCDVRMRVKSHLVLIETSLVVVSSWWVWHFKRYHLGQRHRFTSVHNLWWNNLKYHIKISNHCKEFDKNFKMPSNRTR